MDQNEPTDTSAQAWAEAQKQMWESWSSFGQAASAAAPFYTDMAAQWQRMAAQGFEAVTANSEGIVKETAERFFESQKALMRFFEFSANAWRELSQKADAGEDWQQLLDNYTEQLRQQLVKGPETMSNMVQDQGKMWQEYLNQTAHFSQPWAQAWQQTPGHLGRQDDGALELTRLYWDTYDQTFGRFLESPSLGYTRELDDRLRKGFRAWQQYRRADSEYQLVVAEAWIMLFEQFQRELMTMAENGQQVESLEALANLWMNTADPIFIEVFRSDKYIAAQNELLNAIMRHRIQQRDIAELVLEFYDIPTRAEVDEAHRSIYTQRKEIKALKTAQASQPDFGQMQQTVQDLEEKVQTLRRELSALKKSVAQPQKSKATTRRSSSKKKPAVTKASDEEKGA
jgi:class III poly(R)-hydroxyalkanoic acid synthase PhaE subunit